MCRTKLEPRNCSEQTTGWISMKFGRNVSFEHTIRTIEAIFSIWPLSRDMGPQEGTPGGQESWKKFFRFFLIFVLYAYLEVPSLAKTGFKSRKLNFSLDSASKLTWCQILLTESSPLSASSNFVTSVQQDQAYSKCLFTCMNDEPPTLLGSIDSIKYLSKTRQCAKLT